MAKSSWFDDRDEVTIDCENCYRIDAMRRNVRLTRGPHGRVSFAIPCFQFRCVSPFISRRLPDASFNRTGFADLFRLCFRTNVRSSPKLSEAITGPSSGSSIGYGLSTPAEPCAELSRVADVPASARPLAHSVSLPKIRSEHIIDDAVLRGAARHAIGVERPRIKRAG